MTGRMSLPAGLVLAFEQLPEPKPDEDKREAYCEDCGARRCVCDRRYDEDRERWRYGD